MSEYINRDEAYQRLHAAGGCDAADEWSKGYDDGITEAIRIINEMSAANVAPVVHRRYKKRYLEESKRYDLECSECGFRIVLDDYDIQYARYCNNCGAKMYESEDNSNE